MDHQDMLGVLLSMTEQQQKAIAEAVEALKKQTASLNGVAPDLQKAVQAAIMAALARSMGDVAQGAQTAVKASVDPVLQSLSGVVEAANQAEAKLNRAVAAFGRRWLMLAGVSVASAFFALLITVYAAVWWERSELESLKAEKATLQENIASFDKLKGHIKISNCGENKRPCVEVDTKTAFGTDPDHNFYILKGVK
jgi:glutathione S-transferase